MKNILFVMVIAIIATIVSCGPRVDLDKSQWGDHAYINNVQVFTFDEQQQQLQEYYENEETTTAIRRNFVHIGNAAIDSTASTALVTVEAGTDLSNVGIIFFHRAQRIEPIGSAPIAGFLDDFSAGPYQYRLFSADGTQRDWTVSFDGE